MPTRTTLTLDDDVAAALQGEARRTGRPLRAVVNAAIRSGLERKDDGGGTPFRVKPHDMGLREAIELDDISGLLERIEGPEHR